MEVSEALVYVVIGSLMWGVVGYVVGKYSERLAWNKLIRDGLIPPPTRTRRTYP